MLPKMNFTKASIAAITPPDTGYQTYRDAKDRHELAQFFTDSKITCVFSGHIHQDIDIVWEGVRLITSIGTSNWHHYPEETAFKLVTVFDGGFSVRRASAEGTTRRGPV
ncbi:MAG: hypothetical protein QGF67_14525 [Lentisphaeria bacterium]|jgi:hypothetical protein|nr:hypothetical protein [Lentisphaeria bacterium]MDP7742654.1 hypothetical protein [Lentisphaeria bacterium]